MISVWLLLVIMGGLFITSGLFKEELNTPKDYLIILSITILLLYCFTSRKRLLRLRESLHSRIMESGLIVICTLVSIHGFLQYFGLLPSNHLSFPITGAFENPAGFAAAQVALFPFVISKSIDNKYGKTFQLFSAIVSLLCLISVILSGSRAGFLSLLAVIVVVLAFSDTCVSYFKTHSWLWLPLILMVVSISIILYYLKQDSADGRLFIWDRCFEMIKKHLLFGYGPYGFHRCYMSAQADYFQAHQESPYIMLADNVAHPFNEYIKLTVNYGILGLLLAIVLLVWIVLRLLKSDRHIKILGLSFVAGLFVMCQFSYPFRYAVVWLLTLMAILPAFLGTERDKIAPIVQIFIIPMSLLLLVFVLKNMYYDMKWAEISKRSLIGQTDRMLKYYDGMIECKKHDPLFLYNYAAELNKLGRYDKSIEFAQRCAKKWNDYDVQILLASNYSYLQNKEEAIRSFDSALFMIPCRFEPLYGKMTVYINSHDTINTLQVANEITEKTIKVRSERVSFIVKFARHVIESFD